MKKREKPGKKRVKRTMKRKEFRTKQTMTKRRIERG